jgi:hypothetical protein
LTKKSLHKGYAPCCSLPGCNERVDYHDKTQKDDNTWSIKWKTFCEYHRRGYGKTEADEFKKNEGCEAHKINIECPGHHGDLTIDHFDGNKHNVDVSNILVLCPNCHQKKTLIYKDNTNRYYNAVDLPNNLWEIKK